MAIFGLSENTGTDRDILWVIYEKLKDIPEKQMSKVEWEIFEELHNLFYG
jgi:hypothetical protein